VDHENSAEQRVAKTESDAPDESESPDHQPEATGASVVGILGAEQQGTEPEVTKADDGSVTSGTRQWKALLRPSTLPVILGTLAGAIAAIIAVSVLSVLRPPLDARVEPLAQQLGTFTQRMRTQETSLRAVEVDVVRTLDLQAEVSAEVAEQNAAIEKVRGKVETVSEQIRAERGPGSSVFGVAVVQLTDGIALGRPFEAEWVNIFALTVDEPELRATLQRLLPFVRTGVDTVVGLRQRLRFGARRIDLTIARPDDIFWIAADYLHTQLGLPIGGTPAKRAAEAALTEADRRLASGDTKGAIGLIAGVGKPFAAGFSVWLEAARRRELADKVAAKLTTVARREISERARRQASAQGGNVRGAGRRTAPPILTR